MLRRFRDAWIHATYVAFWDTGDSEERLFYAAWGSEILDFVPYRSSGR